MLRFSRAWLYAYWFCLIFLICIFFIPLPADDCGLWMLVVIAAYLSTIQVLFLLLPCGTITIIPEDKDRGGYVKNVKKLEIFADGRKIDCKTTLPQQKKIYFWRRAFYKVLVVVDNHAVFQSELNLLSERTAGITILVPFENKVI